MAGKVRQVARKSILLLLPDMPSAVGTGGQVRIYQFAEALAKTADVAACVLVDQSQGNVPNDLKNKLTVLYQPNSAFQDSITSQRQGVGSRILRALSVLIMPWKQNGRDLMNAGNVNCVVRSEKNDAYNLGRFHSLYATLVQIEAILVGKIFNIFPSDALIRYAAIEKMLPVILNDLKNSEIDIIWCEHSYLYPIAERLKKNFPNSQLVVNAHNVEWILKQGISETKITSRARRWILSESALLKHWEKRMLLRADIVFCCSEQDAGRFRELAPVRRAHLKVIPNGVDTDYFKPLPVHTGTPTILFMGTAGYPPNDDAVAWMVADIFPLIRTKMPECRLILAGRDAAKHWSRYVEDDPHIEVASDVPDMRPWLEKATVCTVPLRAGSGTRLKILEAMGAGRAVVSTRIGAEGIDAEPEMHLLLADTPESFADSVLTLINDDKRRFIIEQAARELVCERYEWSRLVDVAIDELGKLDHKTDVNS